MSSEEEEQVEYDIADNQQIIFDNVEDLNIFYKKYDDLKKNYRTSPYLNKYEKTKVLHERVQQLANNSKPLISNPQNFHNIYEIAVQELKQKKIPFIIKRPINNSYEYWKLEDLKVINL